MAHTVGTPLLSAVSAPQPLDLSATSPHCSVIKGPGSVQPTTVLPQCNAPNLNSNWIAMKFGAAVGPNRMSYPREFKLMVIDYFYANGQNKYRTCKEFQITKSMLNGWLQKVDKIRQSRPGALKSGRSGRRPQFPDIEKQLFTLYQSHLLSGQKVGNRWIRETARDLARKQCSVEELGGMCQFSERWLSNFKKRYRINLNRDWSSGSCASSTASSSSNPELEDPPKPDSPAPSSEQMDEEESSSGSSVQEEAKPTPPVRTEKPEGVLPIHEFYRQYPWLIRRSNALNYEPGRRGRKVQFPQVEKVLYERLLARQGAGHRVSNRWLQQEARGLAAELCPQVLAEATKSARCMFSEHWLHNFKKRYGVSLKQTGNRALPESPSPSAASQEPAPDPPPPEAPTAQNPVTLAALFQMQQWLIQQSYLSSLARFPTLYPPPTAPNNGNVQETLAGVNLKEWYTEPDASPKEMEK